MKTAVSIRNKAFKVAATGASLVAAQPAVAHETGCQTLTMIESRAVVSSRAKLGASQAEATHQMNRIVIPNESEWDENSKVRFGDLSREFALGSLSSAESAEFETLKTLRRRANPSRSFEQIKSDIEFHRAVQTAIAGLQQLIDHGTRIFRAET